MKSFIRHLLWIMPASLLLGAILTSLQTIGYWWIGWLSSSFLILVGSIILIALWHWAGASRTLAWILVISLFLRFGLGLSLNYILPAAGYGTEVEKAGYVFYDAYYRDNHAWELASSDQPLWLAFDKSYSTDQYGGMLAMTALIYRYLSPDAHRPWLILLLIAFTSAIGIAVAWKTAERFGGRVIAALTAGILALYPESILQGSSQMREPFLITFIIFLFWGVVNWSSNRNRWAWAWISGATIGLLLFSPGVASFALITIGIWFWLQSSQVRVTWQAALVSMSVLVVALFLFWLAMMQSTVAGMSPLQAFTHWFQFSANFDVYQAERSSGWIQLIFEQLPKALRMPFMTGYGLTQPVLPAVIADPAAWPWKMIGIFRALGWYALLPFLVSSLVAIIQMSQKNERWSMVWLWIMVWVWILMSSYRAGGDQWDSPRYRVILLVWQALLTAKTWVWWRETHNPWMIRIIAVECVFLLLFGYWYAARYTGWTQGQVHVFFILALILIISAAILLGGLVIDRRRTRVKPRS